MENKWKEIVYDYLKRDLPFTSYRELLIDMKNEGVSRENAYSLLTDVRSELVAKGDEKNEDRILEVLDIVSGNCSPHLKVWQ